jgi:hypothetical protein
VRHWSPPLAVTNKLNKAGYFGRVAAAGWGGRRLGEKRQREPQAAVEPEGTFLTSFLPDSISWRTNGSHADSSLHPVSLFPSIITQYLDV